MCLGIPAKIISREGDRATVRIGKVEYIASLQLLPESQVGDYIILHAGFAIEKIDTLEAKETIRLFREIMEGPENSND